MFIKFKTNDNETKELANEALQNWLELVGQEYTLRCIPQQIVYIKPIKQMPTWDKSFLKDRIRDRDFTMMTVANNPHIQKTFSTYEPTIYFLEHYLQLNKIKKYNFLLHEIGHLLGFPHIDIFDYTMRKIFPVETIIEIENQNAHSIMQKQVATKSKQKINLSIIEKQLFEKFLKYATDPISIFYND